MNLTSDEKGKSTFRRLLLSKELYLHGLWHSNSKSSLDKMIAIHNFHNSLEIALRSIFLHHEIRPEKHLNIDFESMLNEIDSYKTFKEKKIKLPYRQELRNLNQIRNLVQHHAVEPESSTMEDWRVFTRRFLTKTFDVYFNIQFDEITSIHFIENADLKNLLLTAYKFHEHKRFLDAMVAAKLTFIYSSYSIREFLPSDGFNSDFFVISNISSQLRDIDSRILQEIEDTIRKIYDKIDESKLYSAIISSGVSFTDYKQYQKTTPSVTLTLDGSYVVQIGHDYKADFESASWVLGFVEQTIIKWQLSGIAFSLNEQLVNSCKNAIDNLNRELEANKS